MAKPDPFDHRVHATAALALLALFAAGLSACGDDTTDIGHTVVSVASPRPDAAASSQAPSGTFGDEYADAQQRLRDVLGFQIGDGTAQIMKTIIARARAGRRNVPA